MNFLRLFLGLSLIVAGLSAQEIEVRVDEKKIGREDVLSVEVTVEGQDPGVSFQTQDFEVQVGEQGSQIQIVNGQVRKFNRYRYQLMPRKTGSLSFTVQCGSAQKGPFTVEVVEGRMKKAPPADPIEEMFRMPMGGGRGVVGDDEVLLRNEVSSSTVYNGQAFFLDNVLYLRTEVMKPGLVKDDDHPGFTAEMIPDHGIPNQTVVLNGQPYNRIVLRRKAMFSLLSGNATIKGWTLRFRKGGGFFAGPARDLTAPDLPMTVLPLPENGKPTSFKGAVGEFTLDARLSPKAVKTHDGATLVYVISGRGQARTLSLPGLTVADPDLQARRSRTDDRFKLGAGGWEGSLSVEYLLIPSREKTYAIPPATWTYFSPSRRTYVTLTTPALSLSATRTPGTVDTPTRKDPTRDVETLRDDIRYLRVDPPSKRGPGWATLTIWFLHGIAWALLATVGVLYFRRWFQNRSPAGKLQRLSRAFLSEIKDLPHDLSRQDLARRVEEILRGFTQQAFGISSGIPLNGLEEALNPHLSPDLRDGYLNLIRRCQAVRYGGDSPDSSDSLKSQALAWLQSLAAMRKTGRGLTILFVSSCILTPGLFAVADGPAWNAAGDYYSQGQYLQAWQIFNDQIQKHGPDADLLYQRGCAATRLWGDVAVTQRTGYLAQAIRDFHHSKALRDLPDVRHNLEYLESRVGDQIRPTEPSLFSMVFFFHYHLLSATHLYLISGVLWFLGALAVVILLRFPSRFSRTARLTLLGCFALPILFTVTASIKSDRMNPSRYGWIRLDAIDLHSGPTTSTPVLLVLHEGSSVRPIRENEGWLEVRLADGRLGWLPKEAVLR